MSNVGFGFYEMLVLGLSLLATIGIPIVTLVFVLIIYFKLNRLERLLLDHIERQ